MKKIIYLLILVSLVSFGAGCNFSGFGKGVRGSGNRVTQKRDVPAFLAIEVSGAYEIEITAQKERSLEITGDDNILPLVRTEVRGNVLHIDSSKGFNINRAITLKITVPDLEGISTSGASKITVGGINNSQVDIDSSGASKIAIAGETKKLKIGTSGASNIEAKELRAERVDVESSGAGYVSVYATEQLDAAANGAARIDYYGNPATVHPEASGAGSVNKKS
jgi:predicted small secreted protein